MMHLLFMLALPIYAQSEAPASPSTTAIRIKNKTEQYLPLSSGSTLVFDTPGPVKLMIESRRRMAGAGQYSKDAPLKALGDGQLIRTLSVPGESISSGTIQDRLGGYPSKSDRSPLAVPPGGQQLSLHAPQGGPDFFVRVTDRDNPTVLILPAGVEAPVVAFSPEPVVEPIDPIEPIEPPQAEAPPPKPRAVPTPTQSPQLTAAAGIETGVGIPARGTNAVAHIGITGRLPVYAQLLSAGASIGWHRIRVEENHHITDPTGGYLVYEADYRTTVIPISARISVHVPYPAGPVQPIASVGLGLFIATRTDGEQSSTNIALGPTVAGGCEIAIGSGRLQSTVGWHEARAQFGNQGLDGGAVAETLAVTRLNLRYLYTF